MDFLKFHRFHYNKNIKQIQIHKPNYLERKYLPFGYQYNSKRFCLLNKYFHLKLTIQDIAGFEAHEAVALVDGQGLVLLLREAFAVADPGLPEGVGRFVVVSFFVVRLVGGAEEGPDEVADGGLLSLIIYLDAVLRRENQRAAGKDDGQCDFFHIAVVMMTLRSRFVGVKIARFRHFSKKRCPARKGGYHLYINCYFWNSHFSSFVPNIAKQKRSTEH